MIKLSFTVSMLSILLLSATASAEGGEATRSDSSAVLLALESRADRIRSRQSSYPKLGALQRAELRSQLREIDRVSAQIRAGQTPDSEQLGRLLGGEAPGLRRVDPNDTREVAARLDSRAEIVDRKLRSGSKIGAMRRNQLKAERAEIAALRRDLQRGDGVEAARLEPILPIQRTQTVDGRRADLEIQKATARRTLFGPSKVGALKRAQIREEIEALDAMIAELESRR